MVIFKTTKFSTVGGLRQHNLTAITEFPLVSAYSYFYVNIGGFTKYLFLLHHLLSNSTEPDLMDNW